MELSKERIYYLLQSYSEQMATEEELEELYGWAMGASDDREIKEYVKKLLEEHGKVEFPEVDWDGLYHQILKNTQEEVERQQPLKRNWLNVAAVVLILLVGGGAFYLLSSRNKLSKQPIVMTQNSSTLHSDEIKPGGTKAILKSGNNRVTLTSTDTSFSLAGNKVQISNGDVQIEKIKPVEYTLIVPRGGTYSLVLADGTKVWLNADSKLVYPSIFTGDSREVKLSGEAYFDVKTDAAHPFQIHTKTEDVSVLGTEVNVAAYDGAVNKTTLVKGKVTVESAGEKKMLEPGQQAFLRPLRQAQGSTSRQAQGAKSGAFVVRKVDVKQEIAWKNGYFRFDNADIYTIMKKLERWYDIKVEYERDAPEQHFGAIMNRKNDISRILKLLEATGDVHFDVVGKTVKVSR